MGLPVFSPTGKQNDQLRCLNSLDANLLLFGCRFLLGHIVRDKQPCQQPRRCPLLHFLQRGGRGRSIPNPHRNKLFVLFAHEPSQRCQNIPLLNLSRPRGSSPCHESGYSLQSLLLPLHLNFTHPPRLALYS